MTSRNLRVLSILILLCLACAVQAKRFRAVNDIALAIDLVEQLYVEPVEREKLSQDALAGMMKALDNYSGYIPPEKVDEFQSQIDQSFAGLGVVVTKAESQPLRIVRTIHNSPAQQAGLQVGEYIVSVEGQSTDVLSTDQATSRLRGLPDTTVKLSIQSADKAQVREVTVTRALIETPSLIGDYRDANGKTIFHMQADPRIAYAHMSVFGAQSAKEMEAFLTTEAVDAKAVVWDLRDNAGGLLDAARDLCDMFVEKEVICRTRGRVPEVEEVIEGTAGVLLPKDIPLVILLDEGSASASEVTAACLQDIKRAKIAGQRSYGKGSVQNVIDMDGGRSRLRLTTAYWFPPSNRMINRNPKDKDQKTWGVDPETELLVELTSFQRQQVFTRMFLRDTGNLATDDIIQISDKPFLDEDQESSEETLDDSEGAEDSLEPSESKEPKNDRFDTSSLGDPETLQKLLAADASLKHDPQLLRVMCWLNEQLRETE